MAYARFSKGVSDVYVFEHVDGYLQCCACLFMRADSPSGGPFGCFNTKSVFGMVRHLRAHEEAGHLVPPHLCEGLLNDADYLAESMADSESATNPTQAERSEAPNPDRSAAVPVLGENEVAVNRDDLETLVRRGTSSWESYSSAYARLRAALLDGDKEGPA